MVSVAQTSSLLYRGFPIRYVSYQPPIILRLADWKSAIQQIGNLHYREGLPALNKYSVPPGVRVECAPYRSRRSRVSLQLFGSSQV